MYTDADVIEVVVKEICRCVMVRGFRSGLSLHCCLGKLWNVISRVLWQNLQRGTRLGVDLVNNLAHHACTLVERQCSSGHTLNYCPNGLNLAVLVGWTGGLLRPSWMPPLSCLRQDASSVTFFMSPAATSAEKLGIMACVGR